MNKLTLQAVFVASILVAGLLAFNVGSEAFAGVRDDNPNKGRDNNSGEKGCENSNPNSKACQKNPNTVPDTEGTTKLDACACGEDPQINDLPLICFDDTDQDQVDAINAYCNLVCGNDGGGLAGTPNAPECTPPSV